MTFRDRVAQVSARVKSGFPPVITTNWPGVPVLNFGGGWNGETIDVADVMGMTPHQLWRTQPHLRTVVDFLARNVAQLGLHTFTKSPDGDRVRNTTDPAAIALGKPNRFTTTYELIYSLVGDLALNQDAYWLVGPDADGINRITTLPSEWVKGTRGGTTVEPETYIVQPPSGKQQEIPAELVERFHGWDPVSQSSGVSPVTTLKATLLEQIHAQRYREQQWRRGGRVGAVISRPAGHRWTEDQEKRFLAAFRDAYSGDNAPEGGGVPILQDGMTMERIGFSAKEDEYIEGTKLSLVTVCSVYHVNPTMVGLLDSANYSNVREFRRMLYGDTLGPWLTMLEDRLNAFVLPKLGAGPGVFVEFNIAEKLKGSFEEQAAVMSTSVGAPWMTRNEARARANLPALPGGDELVTPLNVMIGGQASPQDGGTGQSDVIEAVASRVVERLKAVLPVEAKGPGPVTLEAAPVRVKAEPDPLTTDGIADVLRSFFERQEKAVLSTIGAGSLSWAGDRWDAELGADLYAKALEVTAILGPEAAKSLGFDPAGYDPARTEAFLLAVATARAEAINATTRDQVEKSLTDETDMTPRRVFESAKEGRTTAAAVTLATTLAAFATTEAAKQLAPGRTVKTWKTRSTNPRKAHAKLDGETVPIEDRFSNGAEWPGDPRLGADGTANCRCSVEITVR